jgi:hypothetical protein
MKASGGEAINRRPVCRRIAAVDAVTDLGRLYTEAYGGSSVAPSGSSLALDQAATSIVGLALDDDFVVPAYHLTSTGLQPLE